MNRKFSPCFRLSWPTSLGLPFLLLVVLASSGCASLARLSLEELQARIDTQIRDGITPSLVVAVIEGQRIRMMKPAGMANLEQDRAATTATAYMWFSITKLFTATAVMQLQDRGLIDIDDPAHAYVPELALVEEDREHPITIRSLLNHSSGLRNPDAFAWARPETELRPEPTKLLYGLLRDNPTLKHRPGTRWTYSNLGYLVLGRLIARVSGQPYAEYIHDRILTPLGMLHTGFDYDEVAGSGAAAVGYIRRGSFFLWRAKRVAHPDIFGERHGVYQSLRPYKIDGISYGGLIGTTPDLAKFVAMHLNDGEYEGVRILSRQSAQAMRAPQFIPGGKRLPHCLGWHSDEISGVRFYNHMGLGGGFRPAVRLYPSEGQAIVVLTNRSAYQPKSLTRTLQLGRDSSPASAE